MLLAIAFIIGASFTAAIMYAAFLKRNYARPHDASVIAGGTIDFSLNERRWISNIYGAEPPAHMVENIKIQFLVAMRTLAGDPPEVPAQDLLNQVAVLKHQVQQLSSSETKARTYELQLLTETRDKANKEVDRLVVLVEELSKKKPDPNIGNCTCCGKVNRRGKRHAIAFDVSRAGMELPVRLEGIFLCNGCSNKAAATWIEDVVRDTYAHADREEAPVESGTS